MPKDPAQDSKTQGNTGEQNRLSPPSLPKGGGAIRGMGEKFGANPVTGTGSMSLPIATSPGRSGFGPQLSLSYDSSAGNGPFGFGWSLALPSIARKTDKGLPRYQDLDEDTFILSGAEDLVPVLAESNGQWQREVVPQRVLNGKEYQIQRYRPRIEGLFARIERWMNPADGSDSFWRSISKDNITTWYGKSPENRIADRADPTRIFSWLICESCDDKGNVIAYEYKAEDSDGIDLSQAHERNRTDATRSANRYLKRIKYGNRTPYFPRLVPNEPPTSLPTDWLFEVVLDYGEHDLNKPAPDDSGGGWPVRRDPFSTYRAGFEVRTYRLCQRVLMFHHFPDELGVQDYLVRSTDFTYCYEQEPEDARNPIYSFLLSAVQSGCRRETDGSYLKKSLPALEFEYSQPTISEEIHEADPESLKNLPYGLDSGCHQWVDLDGEGLSGVLIEQAGGWFYKPNLSPVNGQTEDNKATTVVRLGPIEQVAEIPSFAGIGSGSQQFLDLAGDGQLDLVELSGVIPGYYERTQDEAWASFSTFASLPVLDWNNPNLRFVDLTGDGHPDILISEDEAFCWHPSLAEAGFGPPERVCKALDEEEGPRLVFADGTQSVYLADLSGDGLTDLVRIRNGEVCYWPNLGYGRFGAKVTMDNAPSFDAPDVFDQSRIRLADIDGSGTTDIIYLGSNGVDLYFNQSGNSWSPARQLTAFPAIDSLASVQTADLLGNGTACLVWSSPLPGATENSLRYMDLMGGQKPHLMVKSVNNLGAETYVHYEPSTKFYLADKLAGRPWISKISFPVHVVERVETFDRISNNRFVTCYSYHHGYFDGIEREFRGFGLVEQWDTEEFAVIGDSSLAPHPPFGHPLPQAGARELTPTFSRPRPRFAREGQGEGEPATNIDESSHVPPVLTKTWFHTGVYVGRDHVSDFFAGLLDANDTGEYYREPGLNDDEARQLLLDDTVLPGGLTLEEEREACRALKGAMLRQEVYALDGTEKEVRPYVVTEQNFTIRMLQPQADNRFGVFFTHAREALTYQYERNPEDPRLGHALSLEVDDFGNVLKSAAIGYGRRRPDAELAMEDQARQAQILITYTENGFTNSIDGDDVYCTPLPAETRTYELTGMTLRNGQIRFSLDELLDAGAAAVLLAYEVEPKAIELQKRLIEQLRTLYRPDDVGLSRGDPVALLPLGQVESLALAGESYKLAFTPGLVSRAYGNKATDGMLAEEGRYVHSQGDENWWIPSGRGFLSPGTHDDAANELAYAREHFFLTRRIRDPFHREGFETESSVSYDVYDLLVAETRDPLGNTVAAGTDYRVLQPGRLTDPNGNQSEVAFDVLGMVVGTAVMGKEGENQGDSLDGFNSDLDEATLLAYIENPLNDPYTILQGATTRLVYDLFAYQRTKSDPQPLPAVACTLVRETHQADLQTGDLTKTQNSFSYSDGLGREIQKKIQAEPGPVVEAGTIVSPRWVGTGWTVFNNKGKPVWQFEPFFASTHHFEFDVRIGVSPILFYDPVLRVVSTLNPNHTWQKVVFDPWRQENWDVNDTILIADPAADPDVGGFFRRLPETDYLPTWYSQRFDGVLGVQEQATAQKTAVHANTPAVAHMDSLGRTYLTVAHNRIARGSAPPVDAFYSTRVVYDIEGNQREVLDALGRAVMRYDYDMLGSQVYSTSMDAGQRWILKDVAGQPIRAWDARGHEFRTEYDRLHRPVHQFVRGTDANQSDARVLNREVLFAKVEYGEGQPNDLALNLRTQPYKNFDHAGVVTSEAFDFKGNLLRSTRQLAADYKGLPDWSSGVSLEAEVFASSTAHDALNRPISLISPDNSEIKPTYNEANLLEQVSARIRGGTGWTSFVENIDYNAKGHRELIQYGNGVTTTYDYDPLTFRLINLKTTRDSEGDLQDLSYTYDPAGNITYIKDDAQQAIFFANTKVTPDADYTYDAIYQLIAATGREHIGQLSQVDQNDPSMQPLPHPNNGEAMRRYTEQYEYDAVGNILAMIHQVGGSGWTRHYEYATDSNRLLATSLPGDNPAGPYSAHYDYTTHGSMVSMPHLPLMDWDFAERLRASSGQVVTNGTPETTYYVYGAAGQRVRKVTERQAGEGTTPARMKERVYLGACEVYREYDGGGEAISLERETLHIMDDKQRIALVETRTQGDDGSAVQLIRYQLSNHLNSASLELDDTGQIISYEEYFPYGSTSYQAVDLSIGAAAKRYRYTGMERDEETGLACHGVRYYAGWLGRWASVDPLSISDGLNLYRYVRNNPAMFIDREGSQTGISECSAEPNFLNASEDELALAVAESEKQRAAYEALLHQTVRDIADPGGYQAGSSGAVGGRILVNWLWFGVAPDASDVAVVLTDAKNTKIIAMGDRYATGSSSSKAPPATSPSALPAATMADTARGPGGPTRSGGVAGEGTTRLANGKPISQGNPLPPDFVDAPPEQPGSFNPNVAKNKLLDAAEEKDTLLQRSHLGQKPFTRTAGPEITLSGHGKWEEGAGYMIVPENTWLNLFGPMGEILMNSRANDVERGLLEPVRTYGPGDVIPNMRLLPPANAEGTLKLVGDPIFLHPMQQQGLLLSEILVPGLGPVNWAACSIYRR